MYIKLGGRIDPPPEREKLDGSGKPNELKNKFKVCINNNSNDEGDLQEQITLYAEAYQGAVEARVCQLFGLPSYNINNYVMAHKMAKREGVRQLDIALSILEGMLL